MAFSPFDWTGFRRQVDEAVVVLFAMVAESLAGGTQALLAEDREGADRLIAEDRRIDRHCEELTALIREHLVDAAGRAADLELLIGILQLVPELERSADLGEHIAQRAHSGLAGAMSPKARGTIQKMNDIAVRMWRAAADAYIDRSRDAGFDLADADDELDELARALVQDCIDAGSEASTAAELALVARFYERLGDHAVNIARRIDAMAGPRRGAPVTISASGRHRGRRSSRWRALLARLSRIRLAPTDDAFFELFHASAINARDCAEELQKMATNTTDTYSHYAVVKQYERTGDQITVELERKLEASFVTPYDREDIHALAEELDDVVDDMLAVAELLHLVHVGEPPPEFPDLADLLVAMATETVELVGCLRSRTGARYHLEKIESLEREGDVIYRKAMARLFSGEYEALDVLKWKDIIQALEDALNTIEDVSDVIESIVVKDS